METVKIKGLCWRARPNGIATKVKELLDTDEKALNSTVCIERRAFGLWTASIVDGWKPSHQMTCVGKSENIAQWVKTLMGKKGNQKIFISIQGNLGFRGMQYAFQEL